MGENHKLSAWIIIWILCSAVIVIWDVSFVFMRPASLPGGNLAVYWLPYAKYIRIDKGYADLNNSFLIAQATMSLTEIMLGIIAIYCHCLKRQLLSILLAYSALLLTANKTLLIYLLEYINQFKNISHNNLFDLMVFYFLPNSIWIVVPLTAVILLGNKILFKNR